MVWKLILAIVALLGASRATFVQVPRPSGPQAKHATQGAEACRACHPQVFAEWRSSHHGSTGRALASPPGGADLAIGSSWVQVYLRRDKSGMHRLVPECYDIRENKWRDIEEVLEAIRGPVMPEEGTRSSTPTHKRSFERDCSGCHVSGTRLREKIEDKRVEGGWRAASIDCEACHGPAQAHVEAWKRMDDGEPLLDLARLGTRAAVGVCARCHGGSPVGSDFTPEDAEHWAARPRTSLGVFSHGAASGQIYQADALLRSACHLQGGLTCTDCHGWHSDAPRHPEHVDAICSRCHTTQASRDHTHHALDDEGGRCVNCHMPRLLSGLMRHQRDHRIDSPLPAASATPDACTACHVERDKAWAAEWAESWWGAPSERTLSAVQAVELARRGDLPQARPLLEQAASHRQPFYRWAAAAWLEDPESITDDELLEGRMLALQLASGHAGELALLRKGLADPSPIMRAMAYATLAKRGKVDIEPPLADLEVASRVSRMRSGVRVALAREYIAAGRIDDALDVLEETVVFAQRVPDAWLVLAGAYVLAGRDVAAGAAVRRWRKFVDPIPYLDSFVSKLTRPEDRALERAVLAAAGRQSTDMDLAAWALARSAQGEGEER